MNHNILESLYKHIMIVVSRLMAGLKSLCLRGQNKNKEDEKFEIP